MLRIGFSTKYFTLWDVTSDDVYSTAANGTYYHSGVNTRFTYHQNLSLDKDKAITKAKSMGCTDLEPDTDLYGRNRSFARSTVIPYVYPDNQFKFGKYVGTEISESNDVSYLDWYFGQTDNSIAKKRLLELDKNLMEFRNKLITLEDFERIIECEKNEFKLRTTGEMEVTFEKNVDYDGTIRVNGIYFQFEGVSEQYYNGFSYYLPKVNGKGKRIKNKTFTVKAIPAYFEGFEVFRVSKLVPVKK